MKKKFSLFLALIILLAILSVFSAAAVSMPDISSNSYLIVSADNGRVLLSSQESNIFSPSETLVVFALLTAIKNADLSQEITIPANLPLANNSLQLKSGEVFSLKDLIEMTALNSSVHSLYSIAYGAFGSPEEFASAIQREVQAMGCEKTTIHSIRFDDPDNKTTLADLAIAGKQYIENELLFNLSRTVCKEFLAKGASSPILVYCTNSLVSNYRHSAYLYGNAYGIKEAFDANNNAYHLLTYTKKGDKKLLVAIANAPLSDEGTLSIYDDAKTLSEFVFDQYVKTPLIKKDEPVSEHTIDNAAKGTFIILKASEAQSALLPADLEDNAIERKVTYHKEIKAPVEKGEILGDITFYFQGNVIAESTLFSDRTVSFQPTVSFAGAIFQFLSNPITVFIIGLSVLVFCWWFLRQIIVANKKTRRKNRKK